MLNSLYSKEVKILLCLILPIMLVCGIIQYASFSARFNEKRGWHWDWGFPTVDDFEQAREIADEIRFYYSQGVWPFYEYDWEGNLIDFGEAQKIAIDINEYEHVHNEPGSAEYMQYGAINYVYSGEVGLLINIFQVQNMHSENNTEPEWCVYYGFNRWLFITEAPTLPDLLSETINTPLIFSTIILLLIMSIVLIERDYRPNASVLTLLRLPRLRERYLLSKLIWPTALSFLFWGLQLLVAVFQRARYLSVVEDYVRPVGQPIWKFDYYRILYPFVEPIWFPATISALCMIPAVIVTMLFIIKGGMKSRVYAILPVIGVVATILTINRTAQLWWIMPVLLVAVYLNSKMLVNKGQIVR